MILVFELSMNDSGWNRRNPNMLKVVNLGRSKRAKEQGLRILRGSPYHYDFGDRWAARITVREIDGNESRRLRQKSGGFAGYDWMVDSIRAKGAIEE